MELKYEDIEDPLNLNELINKYNEYFNYRNNNPNKYSMITIPRPSHIYKFYKLYVAYKLMIEYEKKNSFQHDYILKIRPDTFTRNNLYDCIKLLEYNNLEILFEHDFAYFGRYNIMCHICNLVLCYGKYNYGEIIHDTQYTQQIIKRSSSFTYDYLELAKNVWGDWSESPEVQLFEHVLNYCYINNISYDKLSPDLNLIGICEDRVENINLNINLETLNIPICNGELVDKQ